MPPGHERPDRHSDVNTSCGNGELAGHEAITQVRRRQHFHIELVASGVAMSWAPTEYQKAGGWPSQAFSKRSGIHDVWNSWIICPIGAGA